MINPRLEELWKQALHISVVGHMCMEAEDRSIRRNVQPHFTVAGYQHSLMGIKSGCLNGVLISEDELSLEGLAEIARSHLSQLDGIHGAALRLAVPGLARFPALTRLEYPEAAVEISVMDGPEVLPLAPSFDQFCRGLSRSARSNLFRVRRAADAAGMQFSSSLLPLSPAEASVLAKDNMPARGWPRDKRRHDRFRPEGGRPFRSTLRTQDGTLMSAAGGFIDGKVAVLFHQWNSRHYRDYSPSLVMRSHLINYMIREGVEVLVFAWGCEGTLRSACRPGVLATLKVIPRQRAQLLRGRAVYLASRLVARLPEWPFPRPAVATAELCRE